MADTQITRTDIDDLIESHRIRYPRGSTESAAVRDLVHDLRAAGVFRDARREQARAQASAQIAAELADVVALHQPHPEAVHG